MFYFNNLVRDVKKELSHYLLDNICKNVPRATTKFVYDMVWGILASGSSKISNIGRMLFEKNIKITENRLSLNLMNINLSDVKKNYYSFVFNNLLKFNPNILIDETDVIKPFGNVFEGLNIIHDASKEGKPREKGWPVTGIVSLTENNYVVPLVTNLYSTLMEGYKSINNETRKQLENIMPYVMKNQKATFSFDRGYDASSYATYINDAWQFYVIRAKEKRKYDTSNGKKNIVEIASHYKGKYSFTYKGIDNITKLAKASAIQVTHKDFGGEFWLVIETIYNENDIRVYLTNIDCSTKDGVAKALKSYRLRWRIEEYFRFIKQEYEFEKFMIRDIKSINSLFICMNIAITFLTNIIQSNGILWKQLQEVYQPLTNKEKEEMFAKKYGFHGINLYRAKNGLQIILGHTKGRPEIPGRNRRKRIEQITLF